MNVEQTSQNLGSLPTARPGVRLWPRVRLRFWRDLRIVLVLLLLGSSTIPAPLARTFQFGRAVAGYGFDLVAWEMDALIAKARAQIGQPADEIPPGSVPAFVMTYLERAAAIGAIERELVRRATGAGTGETAAPVQGLVDELADLRRQQEEVAPAVVQGIERQIDSVLEQQGFSTGGTVLPPVQFTFTEPPLKLVVSPRDRIETIYYQMLEPQIGLDAIVAAEAQIGAQDNAVGYITEIGGLGAFPTMVVDRAPLEWVLSTVAHEWVHNYLVFFPLGWNYFASQDMTTINESVAEIVGNEVGSAALAQFYGLSPTAETNESALAVLEPPAFDFEDEMRETRLRVDELLAQGKVDEAEAYMEARRQIFVAQGYPLRVLNQAYFAFHGSYGTSAASTSPIGPKLEELRARMPDLHTFLTTVRSFTSPDDLDRALEAWNGRRAPAEDAP
jgi:hypothetical protein